MTGRSSSIVSAAAECYFPPLFSLSWECSWWCVVDERDSLEGLKVEKNQTFKTKYLKYTPNIYPSHYTMKIRYICEVVLQLIKWIKYTHIIYSIFFSTLTNDWSVILYSVCCGRMLSLLFSLSLECITLTFFLTGVNQHPGSSRLFCGEVPCLQTDESHLSYFDNLLFSLFNQVSDFRPSLSIILSCSGLLD